MKKYNNESGELMIESMLVMIPVLFVVVFIITLGFFFYERWNVEMTADEVAESVAVNYQYLGIDLHDGIQSFEDIKKISRYRYNLTSGRYEADNITRGQAYGKKYMKLVSLAKVQQDPVIEIAVKEDGFAARHVKISVTENYILPFAEGFEVFMLPSQHTYTATAEAVCMDFSDYVGSVNYLANLDGILPFSKYSGVQLVNSILGMIKKIKAAYDTF